MTMTTTQALNKLAKWRSVFTGWCWGTMASDTRGCQGLRDLMEARLIMRAELTAVTDLLIRKGVFSTKEFADAITHEALELDRMLEDKFPGFSTTPEGVTMDIQVAAETTVRLGFPP
jgi:hypothetical protein